MQIIVCVEAHLNGVFDVVVCNNTLTSGNTVIIKKSSLKWINFCELPLDKIEVEATHGVSLFKDLERGIWAGGTSNDFFWKRG